MQHSAAQAFVEYSPCMFHLGYSICSDNPLAAEVSGAKLFVESHDPRYSRVYQEIGPTSTQLYQQKKNSLGVKIAGIPSSNCRSCYDTRSSFTLDQSIMKPSGIIARRYSRGKKAWLRERSKFPMARLISQLSRGNPVPIIIRLTATADINKTFSRQW